MKKLLLLVFTLSFINVQAQKKTPEVCYEIFVRSFADSNGDGIGDINGITAKLDYLKSLGVDALWLTPVNKSPSYHKYDVVDYKEIDPDFGTMADYKRLISEAHKRNIRIIKDFVINHTSDKHPWFLEAKKGKDNPYRGYYVWLSPQKIDSMGIATREKTGDSWEINPWHFANQGDSEKYYALFWGGMPDLNYDNPKLRKEIYDIAKFWLKEVGVDGFRLDAAKHIYPDWEAEKCHAFWQEFRQKMTAIKPDVYIVGEVWTSADKVAPYFKGLPANFHMDEGFAIQKIVNNQKDDNLIQKILADYKAFGSQNPDFIDATIIDNHDQTRIGSVVNGDINKMKVAAQLLLTLPGQPYIYYGEEIGMLGQKPDENLREPFIWNTKENDKSRTAWMKPTFSTDATIKPLSEQQKDPNSIYHVYKNLIAFRKKQPALSQVIRPNLKESTIKTEGVLGFIRTHKSGDVLVIHNLTNTAKSIELPANERKFKTLIFSQTPQQKSLKNNTVELPASGVVILK
ncbi:alpha-amylase family glycosyl hydrolase [Flectobacillus major]|uniref:alpha-amylase family glycosyl hydrolase n=1 Tax=Flectobacillus major TaxID=103 RepID=UPI0003F4D2FD|nr:alpha-amylase family glycosyl hydrolase [Flectobacillus major]